MIRGLLMSRWKRGCARGSMSGWIGRQPMNELQPLRFYQRMWTKRHRDGAPVLVGNPQAASCCVPMMNPAIPEAGQWQVSSRKPR
ncbi:hypothetical protein ALP93_00422 [Pseudomonas syringae pv. helianthi]|nr:hypothetical protein ALP93_00422 [Pseudomonas syringae pv. helianthi]